MEILLLSSFLLFPVYLLATVVSRPAKNSLRHSSRIGDAYHDRTAVPEDRC